MLLINIMKSRTFFKNLKTRTYTILLRPDVLYDSLAYEKVVTPRLTEFERKVLRIIYGPIVDGQ